MQAALIPGRRTALWLALAAAVLPSPALELGPAEVKSSLGERLDARIPLRAREGEWFHAKCLELTHPAIPGVSALTDGTLSVERRRSSSHLRIRSAEPVNEPALAFGVSSSCAGAAQAIGPPVTLLIDPPRVDRAPAPPVPAARAVRVPPAVPHARAEPAAAATPAPVPAARPVPEPAPAKTQVPAAPAASAPAPAATSAPPKARPGDFVLRLSSEPIDVARARRFDDKSRARLRERLRLLDSDDQVAEMLSMRDNLRRLEARVAELQLKLASVPPSFPAPEAKSAAKTPAVEAKPETPAPAVVVPAPPRTEAPQPAVPVTAAPAVPVAKAMDTQPGAAAAPAPARPVEAPKPEVAPKPQALPKAPEPAAAEESLFDALQSFKGRVIGAGIAVLLLLVSLGYWLWSRWKHPPAPPETGTEVDAPSTVVMEEPALLAEAPIEIATPASLEAAPRAQPMRPELTSDAGLATRLGDDTEALRRRYIEERFPEIKAGSIALDDPGSVVKGARLFYEDGAMTRAVELLRFAVEARPAEIRPWLALFEIYRLERLPGEYAELAARFRDRHGDAPQWAKVCSFGRELDPANALFQEPPLKSLETIGPAEARRRAAAHADPIVENWLEAPMDFENEVLATDLRRSLMARAKVEDRDLVPNPMPALRSVEMFSVG